MQRDYRKLSFLWTRDSKHQRSTSAFPVGRKVMVVCIPTSISHIDVRWGGRDIGGKLVDKGSILRVVMKA